MAIIFPITKRKDSDKGNRLIRVGYVVAIFILLIFYLATLLANHQLLEQTKQVDHTNITITRLEILMSYIKDGEISLNGYALTRDERFLEPYLTSRHVVDSAFSLIANEIKDSIQHNRLDTLRVLIDKKFFLLQSSIDLFKNSDTNFNEEKRAKINEDKATMDLIRRLAFRIQIGETFDLYARRKELQSHFNFFNIIIIASLVTGFLILILGFFAYAKENNARTRADSRLDQFQKAFQQSVLEIQEQTLQHISQEIHDNIGQVLSLAKMNLATADNDEPALVREKVNDTKLLIAKAIKDLRNLSHSINSDVVTQMGLSGAIEYELGLINNSAVFAASYIIDGTMCKLDTQKEIILFRIVQEVLNNIIKHSEASEITVNINYGIQNMTIIVTDNGKGFDMQKLSDKSNNKFSLGIKNMRQRASAVRAGFHIVSSPGNGTVVTIDIPYEGNMFRKS